MTARLPAKIPAGITSSDHPFAFRGHLYRRIEDAFTDGATRPRVIPQADLDASWARQAEAHAEINRKRDERKAAEIAATTEAQDRKEADKAAKARQDEAMAYVASYTGTWPLVLNIRADRRWGTKYMKLSERQVEVLLAGKARDAARAEAAQIDRELYAADQYLSSLTTPSQTQPSHTPASQTLPRQAATEGMYRAPDGVVIKVQRALASGSGQLYAKRLDIQPGQTGTFIYVPGLIKTVRPEWRMTMAQAKEFGALYGACIVCGRTLTDEQSIADGIGPVCAGRL